MSSFGSRSGCKNSDFPIIFTTNNTKPPHLQGKMMISRKIQNNVLQLESVIWYNTDIR